MALANPKGDQPVPRHPTAVENLIMVGWTQDPRHPRQKSEAEGSQSCQPRICLHITFGLLNGIL
jgi:hypothetical protein